ncbi:hypothetical protein [Cryptosporangium sp. NPDC048952]|uniref:hypothetical protein n=1 Tax=Cryptosporangium sp. NPDC048952 TaxID=3363961 RepID=UPI00371863B0
MTATTLPPSLQVLARRPARGPRLAAAAAMLAAAATFSLAFSGGVTPLPTATPALSIVSQTVTTDLLVRDEQ